jgi:hypothetical protein
MGQRTVNKRLCVLQVTPTKPTAEHIEYFQNKKDCDFYFVTHDEDHPDALKFCPNTKWAETRNTLAELVPKQYDYYAFVDYDYVLNPQTDLNPLEQILEDLELFEPAVLTYYPGKGLITPYAHDHEYRDRQDYSCIPFTHAGLKIVHHSLLNWFYPLVTKFGGGSEACHLFNILELPFLKNVVCSHKMLYDNGNSDEEAPHNQSGLLNKVRMDHMWEWIMPALKRNNILHSQLIGAPQGFQWDDDRKNYFCTAGDPRYLFDGLLIKEVYVSLLRMLSDKNRVTLETSPKNINYFDRDKLETFFDLNHEHFHNKEYSVKKQSTPIDSNFKKEIESVLREQVTFETMKSKSNPWPAIVSTVNKKLKKHRNINTLECLEIYQQIDNHPAVFHRGSKPSDEFEAYLSGKRVALVGPAPYLMGLGRGKEIDSHDVVVRVQPEIFSTEDYGSRIDIIQSCLNSSYSPKLVKYLEETNKKEYPKFIMCNDTVSRETFEGSKIWSSTIEEYDTYLKKFGVPLEHLQNEDETWDKWVLFWEIYAKKHLEVFDASDDFQFMGYTANFSSGYGAVNMLLRCSLKELSVYGMDFYSFGDVTKPEEKYNPEYIKQQGASSYLGPDELLHDPLAQALHLKNVILKDERVKYDKEVIDKLMSNKLDQRLDFYKSYPRISIHGVDE